MEHIDEYEYNKKDIIGHGAFAIVFRGRERKVNERAELDKNNKNNCLVWDLRSFLIMETRVDFPYTQTVTHAQGGCSLADFR